MSSHYVKSAPATHYTGALAESAVETELFPGLRGDGTGCITSVAIQSKDKLAWTVEFNDAAGVMLNRVVFADTDAQENMIDEVAYYCYSRADLDIPMPVSVPNVAVTVGLRNNSSTAKTAGTAGAVTVIIGFKK